MSYCSANALIYRAWKRAYLLQRRNKCLELSRRVLNKDHAGKCGIEQGTVTSIGNVAKEGVRPRAVMSKQEGGCIEFTEELAGHVARAQIFEKTQCHADDLLATTKILHVRSKPCQGLCNASTITTSQNLTVATSQEACSMACRERAAATCQV